MFCLFVCLLSFLRGLRAKKHIQGIQEETSCYVSQERVPSVVERTCNKANELYINRTRNLSFKKSNK